MLFSHSLPYLLAFLASSVTLISAQLPANCPQQCVRREVRDLSQDERNKYFAAVRQLMQNGRWDTYTAQHLDVMTTAHGTPLFLVWHRAFIYQLERDLQGVDNSVCLHYWSWDIDSQAPEASPIFGDGFYGGGSGCLDTAVVGEWRPQHPQRHCSARSFQRDTLYSPELLNRIVANSNDYESLNRRIESPPHDMVHNFVGGDMGTGASPNDPIFFAHHAFVDLLYYRWQVAHPQAANSFPGSTSQRLTGLSLTVRDTFDISKMCYSYAEMGSGRATTLSADKGTPKPDPKQKPSEHPPSNLNKIMGNVTIKPADPNIYSNADRRNLISLRRPGPVPETFLAMMNISVKAVREMEAEYSKVYDQLNGIYGYVSPSALYNRRDILSKVIKASGNGSSVALPLSTLGLVEINYQNSTDLSQVVANIVQTVKDILPDIYVSPSHLKDKLEPIIGKATVLSAESPSNVYQTTDSKSSGASENTCGIALCIAGAAMLFAV